MGNIDRKAFSLVELSIVLVILGLLTGGILTGQNLIRAAELRSLTTDFQHYQTAVYTFRDKYFAFPGDMNKATDFWGSAGGTGVDSTCVNAQGGTSDATCNGNGDGRVATSAVANDERFMAWKHLANSGLIEGSYTGKTTGASGSYVGQAKVNVPASKLSNGVYDIYYTTGTTNAFAGAKSNSNFLTLFTAYPKPEEAWNIDTKMDDGSPVYGKINVHKPSAASFPSNGCATSDDDDAKYDLANSSGRCLMHFAID